MIRALIAERTDPVLFELSYDYVGDLSETVALMWPSRSERSGRTRRRRSSAVVETLSTLGKAQLPAQLARWLDALDETGRWALLKLVTGGAAHRRLGAARQDRGGGARRQGPAGDRADLAGLAPPYTELFAWLEGRADKPATATRRRSGRRCWRMRSRRGDLAALDPADSWRNGNGTASACRRSPGATRTADRRAALFAHRRGHLQKLSRSASRRCGCPARSTASC